MHSALRPSCAVVDDDDGGDDVDDIAVLHCWSDFERPKSGFVVLDQLHKACIVLLEVHSTGQLVYPT